MSEKKLEASDKKYDVNNPKDAEEITLGMFAKFKEHFSLPRTIEDEAHGLFVIDFAMVTVSMTGNQVDPIEGSKYDFIPDTKPEDIKAFATNVRKYLESRANEIGVKVHTHQDISTFTLTIPSAIESASHT